MHLAAGLSVGLTGLAAGYAIGVVGDVVSFDCTERAISIFLLHLGGAVIHVAIKNFCGHGFDIDFCRGSGFVWVGKSREYLIQVISNDARLIVALILNTRTD
jgi:hypothetical protein